MPFKLHKDLIKIDLEKRNTINYILLPLSVIFYILSSIRKYLYRFHLFSSYKSKVDVIVIGNITVGGSGKTPVVIEVVQHLQQQGKKVGVVSRGYKRKSTELIRINQDTTYHDCGDEPLLIYNKTRAVVAVSGNRVEAIQAIENDVDVIISDDGLQHYKFRRDVEVIVFKDYSNGFLLPAGGLRETKHRLTTADIVLTAEQREIVYISFVNIYTQEQQPLDYFKGQQVFALCGIAKPQAFFEALRSFDINIETQIYPDHHSFSASDFPKNTTIIMTAKDSVKTLEFATENMWYLDISVKISPSFYNTLEQKLC